MIRPAIFLLTELTAFYLISCQSGMLSVPESITIAIFLYNE